MVRPLTENMTASEVGPVLAFQMFADLNDENMTASEAGLTNVRRFRMTENMMAPESGPILASQMFAGLE